MAQKSMLPKILLIGSVGLVGAGIFVWWRGRKLARETAQEIFGESALVGAGAAPVLAPRGGFQISEQAMQNIAARKSMQRTI